MILIGLALTLAAGWFGWSLWLAIPLGIVLFWGSLRATPGKSARINAVGFPMYMLMAFLIMKAVAWVHAAV